MSGGPGHPHWTNQLPRMNDILAPISSARPASPSSLLPTPYNTTPPYARGHGLAQYRSSRVTEQGPSPVRQHDNNNSWTSPPGPGATLGYHVDYTGRSDHTLNVFRPSQRSQEHLGVVANTSPEYRPLPAQHTSIHNHPPMQIYTSSISSAHSTYPRAETLANPNSVGGSTSQAPSSNRGSSASPIADGDHIKNNATGSQASPWGVTKAGKARKRLEQACINCRKKKTKCEPRSSSSKCSPCEKSGIECNFDTAPRSRSARNQSANEAPIQPSGVQNAPMQSSSDQPESSASPRRDGQSSAASVPSSRSSMDIGNLLSPPLNMDSARPNEQGNPRAHKRRRRSLIGTSGADVSSSSDTSNLTPTDQVHQKSHTISAVTPDSPFQQRILDPKGNSVTEWDIDPLEKDRSKAEHYLQHYFTNINMTSYCMFPREKFMKWARTDHNKSSAEKILLYAMLAHGSIFSKEPEEVRKADGKRFAKVAHRAISYTIGNFNLPIVQTRLILGLYEYSLGNCLRSWDYAGAAVRSACGLKLNVERGVQDVPLEGRLDFEFDRETLVECRRRTFWSAFIMDRYTGFCTGHLCMLQNTNCLLRLPCDEAAYAGDRGGFPQTPFYHSPAMSHELSLNANRSGIGMMAYLVEVSAIWGDSLARAYSSEYQSPEDYGQPAERFHQKQMARLTKWNSSLGSHLSPSQENIDKAFQGGYIGVFTSLWLLYHCAAMKLCRHQRWKHMDPKHVMRNISEGLYHARKILEMMPLLAKVNREDRMPEHAFTVSTPFTGYGILTAVDILTAAGSLIELPDLLKLLNSGVEVMEELAQYWSSAHRQLNMIAERVTNIKTAVEEQAALPGKTAFFSAEPIEVTFGLEHDLIYDVPLPQRLRATGLQDVSDQGLELIEVCPRKDTGGGGTFIRETAPNVDRKAGMM